MVVLRDVLVDDRLVSGTELDGVAEVPVREKIGRGQTLLEVLLLVRVQLDLEPEPDDDHARGGGHGSAPGVPGATVAAGLPG